MKPMIFLYRKTFEEDAFLSGYNESNILFAHQKKNWFMKSSLFEIWDENIFFEEIKRNRMKYNYQGPALLLLDGLECHYNKKFRLNVKTETFILCFLFPMAQIIVNLLN